MNLLNRLPAEPRVAVLGDSLIAGLGVRGRSYARLVVEDLPAGESLFLARSTNTVDDALHHVGELREFGPDVIIMSVGTADGIVHTGVTMLRLLDRFGPKSWQGVEGLEPRPWFRGSRLKRWRQRVTVGGKLVLKHVGVRVTGGYRRVPPAEFADAYRTLVHELNDIGCVVVVVGLHRTDERLFPRTNASFDEYDLIIRDVVGSRSNLVFVDPRPVLDCWSDFVVDHLHLSERGHDKVAAAVLAALRIEDKVAVGDA